MDDISFGLRPSDVSLSVTARGAGDTVAFMDNSPYAGRIKELWLSTFRTVKFSRPPATRVAELSWRTVAGQNRTSLVYIRVVNKTLVASQQWKLWICALALGFIGTVQVAPGWATELVGLGELNVLLATATACVVLILVAGSIRCTACGLALVWHAMRHQPVSKWLSWLLGARACPRCSSSHAPTGHGDN